MTTPTTILASVREPDFFREGAVGATDVKPGMLVKIASAAVVPHASAGAKPAPLYIAMESVRPTDGGGVDTTYSETGESIPYFIGLPGEKFYLLLTTSQTISDEDNLTSAGNGYVKKVGSGDTAVFVAREAKTTTSAAALILAEVL